MSGFEIATLVVAALTLAVAAFLVWRVRATDRRLEAALAQPAREFATSNDVAALRLAMDARLDSFTNLLAATSQSLANQLMTANLTLDEKLARAAETIATVNQGLGEVRASTAEVRTLANDIKRLEEILRPPKSRGIIGEVLLENVLGQILDARQYEAQYPLGGAKVDFVLRVGERLVPVDAKFPLESYERMARAPEESRAALRREFAKTVKDKIDDIAAKYIREDLGTYNFALMYVPSEGVYYEAAVAEGDLLHFSAERRVYLVSPSTFYVYLMTIVLGLRGMRLEHNVAAVLSEIERLGGELTAFYEQFRTLGTHLRNAGNKFDDAARGLAAFGDRFDALRKVGLVEAEVPAPPPADEPLPF
jgi:DNA recombination protein RmuC